MVNRKGEWSSLANMKLMKKHYALIPVAAITGAACVMCTAYVAYMAFTKNDLSWTPGKFGVTPPYDKHAEKINKFIGHQNPLVIDKEVYELRREIASEYK